MLRVRLKTGTQNKGATVSGRRAARSTFYRVYVKVLQQLISTYQKLTTEHQLSHAFLERLSKALVTRDTSMVKWVLNASAFGISKKPNFKMGF